MRQHNLRILFFLLVLWGVAVACSRREARFRIGVSQCSEDEWRRQMNSEILREAHFYEDVEVDIRTAVDDNDRQAKDIRELIAEGVDLLIVAPNEATPITPVVEEAYNRGIPVIVKLPSTSLIVPFVVPFSKIFAPITGKFSLSEILPLITVFCAETPTLKTKASIINRYRHFLPKASGFFLPFIMF